MFRVRWTRSALNELASLWLAADSQQWQAITAAAQAIDQQLQSDPLNRGESRPNGRRIFFVSRSGFSSASISSTRSFGSCRSDSSEADHDRG
jgi:hypothetical protein